MTGRVKIRSAINMYLDGKRKAFEYIKHPTTPLVQSVYDQALIPGYRYITENILTDERREKISKTKLFGIPIGKGVAGYTATTTYATPFLYVTESMAGMEPIEILKTRGISAAFQTINGPYYKWIRRIWATYVMKCDKNSPELRKFVTNATCLSLFQAPIYLGFLKFAGASSEEKTVATGLALTLLLATSDELGKWLDAHTKFWKLKPVLHE